MVICIEPHIIEWDDTKIESSKEVAKLEKSNTDTESISMNNQIQSKSQC